MTKLLQKAMAQMRELPAHEQDLAAESLLSFAQGVKQGVYALSREERAAINASKVETRRGKFATTREVEAAYKGFRA